MRHYKILKLFFSLFLFSSFYYNQRNNFSLEITFHNWLNQPFVKYTLSTNRIKVETSRYDDFRKTKILYNRKLSKLESDSLFISLSTLKIDTSKANCNNPVLDGLFIGYQLEGEGIKPTIIKTHSCITRDAAKLLKIVEEKILKKKFTYDEIKN